MLRWTVKVFYILIMTSLAKHYLDLLEMNKGEEQILLTLLFMKLHKILWKGIKSMRVHK